jgi:predicted RNA binding protein YcfA (HicA-like mRNA interferase family)
MGRLGWRVVRVRGSHRTLKDPAGRVIVVAFHSTLSAHSIRRALREGGTTEADFEARL